MRYTIFPRVDPLRSVHLGSFHFQRHIPRATDSRNVSANYPVHDSRFHTPIWKIGAAASGYHLLAGGNNATRRQGGSWRWEGNGEKGLFPREGTICRENFKNATPWSARNEISQRILIRLRPAGRGRSIQIIRPPLHPLPPFLTRCDGGGFPLPRKTHLVRLWTDRYPMDEISGGEGRGGGGAVDASRDRFWRLLDRRTYRRLVSIYSRFDLLGWTLIFLH